MVNLKSYFIYTPFNAYFKLKFFEIFAIFIIVLK